MEQRAYNKIATVDWVSMKCVLKNTQVMIKGQLKASKGHWEMEDSLFECARIGHLAPYEPDKLPIILNP